MKTQERLSLIDRTLARCLLAALCGLAGAAAAQADALPDDPLQRRCWLEYTAARTAVPLQDPTAVTFTHLRNGFSVRSPFWVDFGVRGMGVIPAGNPLAKAGHHHMLIDKPLPVLYQEKIPATDMHRHYGKGQTGTLLELPPGEHTLRLLFADHDHRPYFVYSPEIRITVAGTRTGPAPAIDPARFAATCPAWYQDQVSAPLGGDKRVYVKNFRDGEPLASPFMVSLGVIGYGVAPAEKPVKDTGYFVLSVTRNKGVVARLALADGRTETRIDLPQGDYTLELSFLRADGTVLLKAPPMRMPVVSSNEAWYAARLRE